MDVGRSISPAVDLGQIEGRDCTIFSLLLITERIGKVVNFG